MENPIKMDDLGVKPTIFGNTQMVVKNDGDESYGRIPPKKATSSTNPRISWKSLPPFFKNAETVFESLGT